MTADLYLGGALGAWALSRVSPRDIRNVVTVDPGIVEAAQALGIATWIGNANSRVFDRGDIAYSVHYPEIFKPPLLDAYRTSYNLHPGYLPWGRGFYPVFWALWEGTPAGATLHQMTALVDEGPIVAQTRVAHSEGLTGGALHALVRQAEQDLFVEYWPKIVAGEDLPAWPQPHGVGSKHLKEEFLALRRTNWQAMTGFELVRLIRCLTFPGYPGLEVLLGETPFELSLVPVVDDVPATRQTRPAGARQIP